MAVAPLNKVNQVALFATTQIPPAKTSLGVPNYGYDWSLPWVQGNPAQSIGNEEAIDIARNNRAIIKFDTIAQSPFFEYGSEDGVSHIVWFEDARSIEAKLKLVKGYNMKGIGIWNIMKPFTQMWVVAREYYDIVKI